MKDDYPYDEAIKDLTVFFEKHIKDQSTLNDLLNTIEGSREIKTVTLKGIYYDYIKYTREFNDHFELTTEEKKCGMIC